MPRPRSLTPDAIAAAALAVLDRDGLAGLSMRAVAGELGRGTMSLYRYVADRDELEGLIVDRILAAVELVPPAGASWRRQVIALVDRLRAAVGEHPDALPLLLRRRHDSVASLRWIEAILSALHRGGFTGSRRAIAARTVISYLIGALQAERYGALTGSGTAVMAELPEERYPLLVETARRARRISSDEEFRRGLDAVLRGLAPAD